MEAVVTENAAERRFEVHADGELAGFASYRDRDGTKEFFHTHPEYQDA